MSGADFISIQAAIDSISDATVDNPYEVWVAPGVYEERVILTPYVHLKGAGRGVTVINSDVAASALPPQDATVTMARGTSLSSMSIYNTTSGIYGVAVSIPADSEGVLLAGADAFALGSGSYNLAVAVFGLGTTATLQEVRASAGNGVSVNYALYNGDGASSFVRGGKYVASGPGLPNGIFNTDAGTILEVSGAEIEASTAVTHANGATDASLLAFASGSASIGTAVPAAGLKLDVEGRIGATEYCDSDGLNCVSAQSLMPAFECQLVAATSAVGSNQVTVNCPDGTTVVGGGCSTIPGPNAGLFVSWPAGNGWTCTEDPPSTDVSVRAICCQLVY